jgi:L-lysine epsilon oxidase-like protein
MATDRNIVRALIHPAIGIARVGNSNEPDGYFVGPEVVDEPALAEGQYKDKHGALKRQAARFHIYGGTVQSQSQP